MENKSIKFISTFKFDHSEKKWWFIHVLLSMYRTFLLCHKVFLFLLSQFLIWRQPNFWGHFSLWNINFISNRPPPTHTHIVIYVDFLCPFSDPLHSSLRFIHGLRHKNNSLSFLLPCKISFSSFPSFYGIIKHFSIIFSVDIVATTSFLLLGLFF